MSRSVWKGPFIKESVLNKIKKTVTKGNQGIKIYNRGSTILPLFIGKVVSVHNGKKFTTYAIKEDMVGHKFGEFSPTKSIVKRKKK